MTTLPDLSLDRLIFVAEFLERWAVTLAPKADQPFGVGHFQATSMAYLAREIREAVAASPRTPVRMEVV